LNSDSELNLGLNTTSKNDHKVIVVFKTQKQDSLVFALYRATFFI
jgi:hypothetical protein